MGIKSLNKFLCEKCPEIFEAIHISEYQYKKIAIDISLYMCNFKSLYGEEGWLGAFIKMVVCLRENDIHCVFVYDSGSPPEKEAERRERRENRDKTDLRVTALELAIEKYHMTSEIDQILIDLKVEDQPKLIRPVKSSLNIQAIEYKVKKMRQQLFNITPTDFEVTRKLFDILDVPYLHAPMEAETMCADLCKQGKVDAVLSEDTDVLAYGTPCFLSKFNTMTATCLRISHDKLLESLSLKEEEFLDFCIMCGTDYNKNIFRIGPSKAYNLIQKHRSIDVVGENMDVAILNHKRTRELFQKYERATVKIPYCGFPNFPQLQQFLMKKNLRISVDSLQKAFTHNIVIQE